MFLYRAFHTHDLVNISQISIVQYMSIPKFKRPNPLAGTFNRSIGKRINPLKNISFKRFLKKKVFKLPKWIESFKE